VRHRAGGLGHRALVGAEESRHAFLVNQTLCFRLTDFGPALAVGEDELDLGAPQIRQSLARRQGQLDVGDILVHDLRGQLQRRPLIAADARQRPAQRQNHADPNGPVYRARAPVRTRGHRRLGGGDSRQRDRWDQQPERDQEPEDARAMPLHCFLLC
jgi:hypothetical protein